MRVPSCRPASGRLALARLDRHHDPRWLDERLVGQANDIRPFSEEFDRHDRRVGRYPQPLAHVSLINTASHLTITQQRRHGAVDKRREE